MSSDNYDHSYDYQPTNPQKFNYRRLLIGSIAVVLCLSIVLIVYFVSQPANNNTICSDCPDDFESPIIARHLSVNTPLIITINTGESWLQRPSFQLNDTQPNTLETLLTFGLKQHFTVDDNNIDIHIDEWIGSQLSITVDPDHNLLTAYISLKDISRAEQLLTTYITNQSIQLTKHQYEEMEYYLFTHPLFGSLGYIFRDGWLILGTEQSIVNAMSQWDIDNSLDQEPTLSTWYSNESVRSTVTIYMSDRLFDPIQPIIQSLPDSIKQFVLEILPQKMLVGLEYDADEFVIGATALVQLPILSSNLVDEWVDYTNISERLSPHTLFLFSIANFQLPSDTHASSPLLDFVNNTNTELISVLSIEKPQAGEDISNPILSRLLNLTELGKFNVGLNVPRDTENIVTQFANYDDMLPSLDLHSQQLPVDTPDHRATLFYSDLFNLDLYGVYEDATNSLYGTPQLIRNAVAIENGEMESMHNNQRWQRLFNRIQPGRINLFFNSQPLEHTLTVDIFTQIFGGHIMAGGSFNYLNDGTVIMQGIITIDQED